MEINAPITFAPVRVNAPISLGTRGATGATGATGAAGADGQGVPAGGSTDQVLKKTDETDYNPEWADPSGGSSDGLLTWIGL